MILPLLQTFAPGALEHVLNSLPEGLLIALFAWVLLRALPKQNSRTRFAIWFVSLIAVAAVPIFDGLTHSSLAATLFSNARAPITLSAYWAGIIFIVWTLAAVLMAARLGIGLWRLRDLRRTCNPVDPVDLDPSLRDLLLELNSAALPARTATLATSERLRVPAAIGLWKPMVVIPAWALRELSANDLGIILRHEFAHLRHWDDWTNFIQKLVRVIFFFHPAVWWIEKQLAVEREMACDDVVVAQTANPTGYANCLVTLLERSLAERGWTMAHALVHRAREASMRLARILDQNRPVATCVSRPALGAVVAFGVVCLAMLSNSPRIVSFEQSSNANSLRAAAGAWPSSETGQRQPATLAPAVVIPAAFRTGALADKKTAALVRAHVAKASLPRPTSGAGRATAVEPADRERGLVDREMAARRAAENFVARSLSHGLFADPLVEDPMFEASQLPDADRDFRGMSAAPALPTVVLVRATAVESDSKSPALTVVWHVQIWRLTLVNPTGDHKVRVPAAHAT